MDGRHRESHPQLARVTALVGSAGRTTPSDAEIMGIPVAEYELWFSRRASLDGQIPHGIRVRLVLLYLLSMDSPGALRDSSFHRLLDFQNFIETSAGDFYFSRDAEHFVESFCRQRGLDAPEEGPLGLYLARLVALCPDTVIDDLIYDALRTTLSSDPGSVLRWICSLLACKNLRRETLRHIFHRIVYFETGDRAAVYRALRMLIRRYAVVDRFIRAAAMEREVEEGTALMDRYRALLGGGAAGDEIRRGLLDMASEASALRGALGDEREGEFYAGFLSGREDLSADNGLVLANLVWEDLVHYLRRIEAFSERAQGEMVRLLSAMVEETGVFLRKRIFDNRDVVRRVRRVGAGLGRGLLESPGAAENAVLRELFQRSGEPAGQAQRDK